MSESKQQTAPEAWIEDPGLYVLYAEARSRFEELGGLPLPPEDIPHDGLCRVMVDHDYDSPRPPRMASRGPRTCDELAVHLRSLAELRHSGACPPSYPGIAGMAAARLCGEAGWVWAVGATHLGWAGALPAATKRDIAVLRLSSGYGLFIYRLPTSEIGPATIWTTYHGGDGLLLFGFDRAGTTLERALIQLEASVRNDRSIAAEEWRRIDLERAARPRVGLRELVARAASGTELDVPPAALAGTIDQWDTLRRACCTRATLRALCEDALFCVLPDGAHCTHAAFNAVQRSAEEVCAALTATCDVYRVRHRTVQNTSNQFLEMTDVRSHRTKRQGE